MMSPTRNTGGRRLTHVESAPPAATIESTKTCGPQQGAALMKRTTKYVAFDVHQATTVASVREVSGRVIARSVLPTDSGALTEFVRGMRGARHVTFEEGTQAQWLYELLAPLVDRVIVCNRRGAPRQGNKGDQVDADHLSEQLRRGALRAVYHGSADRATLKELTRTYRNLVEDATRVMLRLKALFRARRSTTPAPARAGSRSCSRAGRASGPKRALRRARPPAAAPPQGEGGHGHGGAAGSGVARAADHPVFGTGPGRRAAGHDADAVAVSDQTTPVGLRGAGRGDPLQCRLYAPRRRARAAATRPDDPRAESEPQSRAQGCLQRCGDGRHGAARPLQDFYHGVLARGTREELARLTLTRKLAALTLRLWKKGERYDPTKLTTPAR